MHMASVKCLLSKINFAVPNMVVAIRKFDDSFYLRRCMDAPSPPEVAHALLMVASTVL